MKSRSDIVSDLRKAMEFYGELGFSYLPVKSADLLPYLSGVTLHTGTESLSPTGEGVASDQDREGALAALREDIGDCRRCKLCKNRTHIVFGEGSPKADIMFIGEGPGRDEDKQARPFVGDAGKLLTKLIVKMGLKRDDVYIANIVKCRPPNNRNPEKDEIATCRPFLLKQIEIIKPEVIISLGNVASHALLNVHTPISRLRGVFSQYNDIPVMPTFHPAYLLRNPRDKWLTWEDVQQVLGILKKSEMNNE